jgi:hypothetical protein
VPNPIDPRTVDTYDDDEENEDERPVERPKPKVPPPAARPPSPPPPPDIPSSPEAAAAMMSDEAPPMSPVEEIVHRAGPRTGGKVIDFKRRFGGGVGQAPVVAPSPVMTGRAEVRPEVRTAAAAGREPVYPPPSEPEVIVVPVAPTPAPTNPIAALIIGAVFVGGAILVGSLFHSSGQTGETDDDDEPEEEEDETDAELEALMKPPAALPAPKKKRAPKAKKLEDDDVIEGEIVEDEDAA